MHTPGPPPISEERSVHWGATSVGDVIFVPEWDSWVKILGVVSHPIFSHEGYIRTAVVRKYDKVARKETGSTIEAKYYVSYNVIKSLT